MDLLGFPKKRPNIKSLMDLKKTWSREAEWQDIFSLCPITERYWAIWYSLHLVNGALYRIWESDDERKLRWQLLLTLMLIKILTILCDIFPIFIPKRPKKSKRSFFRRLHKFGKNKLGLRSISQYHVEVLVHCVEVSDKAYSFLYFSLVPYDSCHTIIYFYVCVWNDWQCHITTEKFVTVFKGCIVIHFERAYS